MPGNVDLNLFLAGFGVGAASVVALGLSFAEEHGRRRVLPITIAGAICAGLAAGWALNFFFHWAQAPTGGFSG